MTAAPNSQTGSRSHHTAMRYYHIFQNFLEMALGNVLEKHG
jgi:hypothetical protein